MADDPGQGCEVPKSPIGGVLTRTAQKLCDEANGRPPAKHDGKGGTTPPSVARPELATHVTKDHGTAHAGDENKGVETTPQPKPGPIDQSTSQRTVGIDVSQWQSTIDWNKVKNAGVQFAYIRSTDGSTIQDSQFENNWQNAEKAGVLVGPYHYFTTTSPVQTQIDNFVATVGKVDKGDLPPVLDVEDPSQFANLSANQSVALIKQWLDGVQQKLGVRPLLYMSSSFSSQVLGDSPTLSPYKLWVADWTTASTPIVGKPWSTWTFWQHASNGQVSGITGDVDLDYYNGPAADLADVNNNNQVQSQIRRMRQPGVKP
jgi:lysozyme